MKSKSNDTVIIEAMAARIRELEGQIENQHLAAEEKYNFNSSVKSAFSEYITDKNSGDTFLDFEKHINALIGKYRSFQPALLEVYLWVFEIAMDEGLLNPSASGLDKASSERIINNVVKYRAQLKHWEQTGEPPKD